MSYLSQIPNRIEKKMKPPRIQQPSTLRSIGYIQGAAESRDKPAQPPGALQKLMDLYQHMTCWFIFVQYE